jgi:hypothetical protein
VYVAVTQVEVGSQRRELMIETAISGHAVTEYDEEVQMKHTKKRVLYDVSWRVSGPLATWMFVRR